MTELLEAVRYWSEEQTAAKSARDDAIRAAVAGGASLRVVAEHAGLSHSAVAKIVRA